MSVKEDLILRLVALPDSLCLDLLSAAANRAEAAGLAQVMILLLWKQVASDDNLSDIKEEIRGWHFVVFISDKFVIFMYCSVRSVLFP